MAKVPLPERGQPIDVNYIYQLSNAINDLSDDVSSATYNYTSIRTSSAGVQNIKTSESRVVGSFELVANEASVTQESTKEFTVDFDNSFKYPPIVTATPVNTGTSSAGDNVNVVLTTVSRDGVRGIVQFNEGGTVSVIVNVIAVGIPQ